MADIPINAVHRRIQYTSTGSVGPYSFSFAVLDEGDLKVYDATAVKTLTTHYTVALNTDGTGSITFTSGNAPTSGNIVTITSDQAVARTSDFTTGGDFKAATINDELDRITIIQQQLESLVRRCIQIDAFANRDISDGGSGPLGFPYDGTPANQAGKFIIFDSGGTALTTIGSDSISLATLQAFTNYQVFSATGNGSTTAYTLAAEPGQEANTQVYLDGVYQSKSNYTLVGTTLTFSTAPPSSVAIEVVFGTAASTYVPDDASIAFAKLSDTVDEDNMASNSATKLPTQQSVKAYVDASGGGGSTLTDEQVEDIVGAMLTGNTETGVAVTYQDSDGTIDFVVSADTAQLVDDAVTAAKLANAINTDIATGVAALPKAGGAMTGAITTNSTFDGVDIATRDGVLTSTTATAAAALPKAGGAMTGAITTNSTFDGVDVATRDGVLTSTTTTAGAALPKAGGTMTGNIAMSGSQTVDGRDLSTDGTKLDTIESSAKDDQSASEIKTLLEDGINSVHYVDASIDLVHMSANSVDSDQYVDGSIDTVHLGNLQVTTGKIAADAIDGTKLADDAVDSEHYTDGSIDTAHYAASSVNATALGADAVTADKIGDNVLNSEHYAAGSIDLEHMSSQSVDEDNLHISNSPTNGYMLTAQSGNAGGLTWAASSTTLGNDSVDSQHYVAASIDNEHLADNAVDSAELAAGAVDVAHMSVNSVDSDQYVDGSIDSAHLADDAVTAAKLANSINTDIATGVTAGTTASAALPKAGGAMTGAITTNSTFDGVDVATRDGVLTSTTTTAGAALPKAGGAMTGAITTNSTFDGRNVATDGTKLDGVESNATADQTAAQIKTALENGINSVHYVDGSIDTAHIADDQITLAKMAGIARGKIIYGDSSGNPAVLAVGSADEVLTHDGTDVSWQASSGGGGGEAAFTAQSAPGTTPTATGTDAIAIGDGAVAGDASGDLAVLAIGARSTATGISSIAIGENADATGANSIAIGGHTTDATSADATSTNTIAIGTNTLASDTSAIAIGLNAVATGFKGLAIGEGADGTATDSIAIGVDARAETSDYTMAFGRGAVSSAVDSMALGQFSTASGARSIAIGRYADSSGADSIAIGGGLLDGASADATAANAIAIGIKTLASGVDSVAIGNMATATDVGEFAFASGQFAADGDAQTSIYVLRNQTTDATQTELFADGSSADISVASDSTVFFRASIVARRTDADNESAAYTIEGCIDNNAGTTALVGGLGTKTIVAEDTSAWDVTISADNTNDGINILVTGEASKTIRWVARVETTTVAG